MASNFKFKLLSQLAKKRDEGGFTLIELLVVVIIIGVLAAVALPNLLGQVGKARETELKNAVGTVNRSQQAYHFEKQLFAPGVTYLGIVLPSEYLDVGSTNMGIVAGANSATNISTNADSANDGTRAFSGRIDHANGTYTQILCISDAITNAGTAPTTVGACPGTTTEVR